MTMAAEGMLISVPSSVLERLAGVLERIETRLAPEKATPAGGLLTKAQVAARLGGKSSIRQVERLVKAGKLKKVPGLGARTARFRAADVERFLAEAKITGVYSLNPAVKV